MIDNLPSKTSHRGLQIWSIVPIVRRFFYPSAIFLQWSTLYKISSYHLLLNPHFLQYEDHRSRCHPRPCHCCRCHSPQARRWVDREICQAWGSWCWVDWEICQAWIDSDLGTADALRVGQGGDTSLMKECFVSRYRNMSDVVMSIWKSIYAFTFNLSELLHVVLILISILIGNTQYGSIENNMPLHLVQSCIFVSSYSSHIILISLIFDGISEINPYNIKWPYFTSDL